MALAQINRQKLSDICDGDFDMIKRFEALFNLVGNTSGTVTQTTSRTTGVTLNTQTGDITLVSAAGSTSYQTFTVNCLAVGAKDVVIVNQVSGTDKYITKITSIAAGVFGITFATTGGLTVEQPVFRYTVLKPIPS